MLDVTSFIESCKETNYFSDFYKKNPETGIFAFGNKDKNMNLPSAFAEQTASVIGKEEYIKLEEALQQESPVSLRINSVDSGELNKVPWCTSGYYLNERLTFTFDPLFHAGCYYVQEASSMFVEQVLKKYVTEPVTMLDLCAAPGGKSTHARAVLPEGSLLVANEVIRNRSQILAENLIKWGHPDVVVTNNAPADFKDLGAFFDVILTDVPCSGEGMFRKDSVAVEEWSPENVNICWQRQRCIIADIWGNLKPGGILIYSTCTYNIKENEENIEWIIGEYGAEPLKVDVLPEWGITGNLQGKDIPVYHFFPHKAKGEGFFLAALRKPEDAPAGYFTPGKNKKKQDKPLPVPKQALQWLLHPDDYSIEVRGTSVVAFTKAYSEELIVLQKNLKLLHAGITLGEIKGKDLIPDHSLAMSSALNPSAFPMFEVTYEQAIAYLRKEAITLDAEAPRGYVLVTYKDVPLGFVKNIGNRANNLYPNEWRIRSGYLPEEVKILGGID